MTDLPQLGHLQPVLLRHLEADEAQSFMFCQEDRLSRPHEVIANFVRRARQV